MRACGPQNQTPRAGGDADAPYLTLRRLAVWLAEPTLRLRTLAALADQARDPNSLAPPLTRLARVRERAVCWAAMCSSEAGLQATTALLHYCKRCGTA
jgi:hypothetical protein